MKPVYAKLCSLLARVMADWPVQRFYWSTGYLICSLLARVMADNMRNATCVLRLLQRFPTPVALLFIPYSI